MSDRRCASGDLCGCKGLALPPEGSRDPRHFCLRCGNQKHAMCGPQFEHLRDNEEQYKDILDDIAPKVNGVRPVPEPKGKKGPQLEICLTCVNQIRSSTTTPAAASAPMPVETPATNTTRTLRSKPRREVQRQQMPQMFQRPPLLCLPLPPHQQRRAKEEV
jgi:hypothetical protein